MGPRLTLLRRAGVALALCFAATGAHADEINLIFATGSPAGSEVSEEFFRPFAERLNAAGKGVLHVDFREGSAISDPAKAYDRVTSDAIQIGFMLPNLVAGKFPRTQVVTLPYIAGDVAADSSPALWRIYVHGTLAKEYDQVRPLAISAISQASLHMAKVLPSPIALTGLKIMVTSKTAADVISRLGGAPISLPPFQVYEALLRHTVDGTVTGWPSFQPFKADRGHDLSYRRAARLVGRGRVHGRKQIRRPARGGALDRRCQFRRKGERRLGPYVGRSRRTRTKADQSDTGPASGRAKRGRDRGDSSKDRAGYRRLAQIDA
jgi:extracellular solute-binding protein (family 7)